MGPPTQHRWIVDQVIGKCAVHQCDESLVLPWFLRLEDAIFYCGRKSWVIRARISH